MALGDLAVLAALAVLGDSVRRRVMGQIVGQAGRVDSVRAMEEIVGPVDLDRGRAMEGSADQPALVVCVHSKAMKATVRRAALVVLDRGRATAEGVDLEALVDSVAARADSTGNQTSKQKRCRKRLKPMPRAMKSRPEY